LVKVTPLLNGGATNEVNNVQKGDCLENKIISYSNESGKIVKTVKLKNEIAQENFKVKDGQLVPIQDEALTKGRVLKGPSLALFKKAKELKSRGEFESALSTLTVVKNINPNNPIIYLEMASIYNLQHHFSAANELAKKALITLRPDPETKAALIQVQNEATNRSEKDMTDEKKEIPKTTEKELEKPYFYNLGKRLSNMVSSEDKSKKTKANLEEEAEKLALAIERKPENFDNYQKLIKIRMSQKFFTEAYNLAEKAEKENMSDLDKTRLNTLKLEADLERQKVKLEKMKAHKFSN
jgi:tetratricopeptide (TPR) repeat protein